MSVLDSAKLCGCCGAKTKLRSFVEVPTHCPECGGRFPTLVDRLALGISAFRKRWPSWLCLPSYSFAVACAVSLAVCGAFLLWAIDDPQFRATASYFRASFGWFTNAPDDMVAEWMWESIRQWNKFGPRFVSFWELFLVALGSGVLVFVLFVKRRTAGRGGAVVLVAVSWISLWASADRINNRAVVRHARLALPRFQAAAAPLLIAWPTEHGILPEAGQFLTFPEKKTGQLLVVGSASRSEYPFREDFGLFIERSDDGVVRFDVSGNYDSRIEYHPAGSAPESHLSRNGIPLIMDDFVRLDEGGWHYVRYRRK